MTVKFKVASRTEDCKNCGFCDLICTHQDNCTGCGACVDACPYEAKLLQTGVQEDGDKSLKTTEIYTHESNKDIGKIKSPLDNLQMKGGEED